MGVRGRRGAAVAVVGMLLVAAACGSDDDGTEGAGGTTPGTGAVAATVPEVVLDGPTAETLQAAFDEGFAASGMPGAAAVVTVGDQRWGTVAGVADLATGAPFPADEHVRIASITKTFTATALLRLVDEGRLSLDDTLDRYVDGITDGDRITVRDLLAMTAGVWDYTSDEELVARFDADPTLRWTPSQTVTLIGEHGPEFEPGTEVAYSDSNYVLLGLILEAVTQLDAADAVQTLVVEPLGLTGTSFPRFDELGVPAPAPTGYRPAGDGSWVAVGDVNPQFAWTAGAMTSTVEDLLRWGEELGRGSLLSPELQAERLESRPFPGSPQVGYGLGVLTVRDLVGHNGAIIGFNSVVLRHEAADATFVVVGNGSDNSSSATLDMAMGLVARLYPDQAG